MVHPFDVEPKNCIVVFLFSRGIKLKLVYQPVPYLCVICATFDIDVYLNPCMLLYWAFLNHVWPTLCTVALANRTTAAANSQFTLHLLYRHSVVTTKACDRSYDITVGNIRFMRYCISLAGIRKPLLVCRRLRELLGQLGCKKPGGRFEGRFVSCIDIFKIHYCYSSINN